MSLALREIISFVGWTSGRQTGGWRTGIFGALGRKPVRSRQLYLELHKMHNNTGHVRKFVVHDHRMTSSY